MIQVRRGITKLQITILVVGLLLSLGACSGAKNNRQSKEPESMASIDTASLDSDRLLLPSNLEFISGAWHLIELDGKVLPDSGRSPSLELYFDEPKIYGFAGCNRFFGTVQADEQGNISFSQIGSTRIACPGDTIEPSYLRALGRVKHYLLNREEAQMQLFDEAGKLLLRFEAVVAC